MNIKRAALVLLVIAFALYIYASGSGITGSHLAELKSEGGLPSEMSEKPTVLFCPADNCAGNLAYLIKNSENVSCAFFDLDLDEVINALESRKVRVVVDADNYHIAEGRITRLRKDRRAAFMHNKFCVFDDSIVWTGSFNPTANGNSVNNNNVIIIKSAYIADNYNREFEELWAGEFGKGERTEDAKVMLNRKMVENYFCPEDWCANKVMRSLEEAENSIYFMTFSFTHDGIGDVLAEKQGEGLEVKGIFESMQNRRYSEMDKLNSSGIKVYLDNNPGAMHHKVFIIDNRTVITGSFNPTKSGDTRNDENLLIIHDKSIAREYLREFARLRKPGGG